MYTSIAVFVHFNYFIDLNYTNPYNLASSRLLRFWVPCGTTGPFNKTFTSEIYEYIYLYLESEKQKIAPLVNYSCKRFP